MFKGIVTAAVGFGVIMTVVVMVSQPAPTASVIMQNITIANKNMVFPLKPNFAVETCKNSVCVDV